MEKNTIVAYNYRYMWKSKDGSLCCRYLCGTEEEHVTFMRSLLENEDVVSAMREYQGEVNYAFIGFTESVKVEKKEENQSEV